MRSGRSVTEGPEVDPRRCRHCGESIGVYEPIRVLSADGTARMGSWLTLRDELATAQDVEVLPEGCFQVTDAGRSVGT